MKLIRARTAKEFFRSTGNCFPVISKSTSFAARRMQRGQSFRGYSAPVLSFLMRA